MRSARPNRQRVEVVQYRTASAGEEWRSADGAVILRRAAGQPHWQALVDGFRVHDADRLNNAMSPVPLTVEQCPLVAVDPHEMAVRLALQESLHVLFDA